MVDIEPALQLAARQHHVISHAQAVKTGLSDATVRRMIHHGWIRYLPGVYLTNVGDIHQTLMAGLLWAGPDAVVSHTGAGVLHGLDGLEDGDAELTVPPGRSFRKNALKLHRQHVPREDRVLLHGFRVTSLFRTLIDVASRVDIVSLAMAVEHAWRRERLPQEKLLARLERGLGRGRAGADRLGRVLDDCRRRQRPMESALEVRLHWTIKAAAGIRLPKSQHPVRDGEGAMRLDFAYPKQRLAIEADSLEHHGEKEDFEAHCDRHTRLAALGWRVLHVTQRQLRYRAVFLRRLRAALDHGSA